MKNLDRAINALLNGKTVTDRSCSVIGGVLYSYAMPIACNKQGSIQVLAKGSGPSPTTNKQLKQLHNRLAKIAIAKIEIVEDLALPNL